MTPFCWRFGEAIRHACLQQGIAQEGLAHAAEIDRSYMGAIERGRQNIGVMHLVRIARALNMTVMELEMEAQF